MIKIINFIFEEILPRIWQLVLNNVFVAWGVALTVIVAIVSIYKNVKA